METPKGRMEDHGTWLKMGSVERKALVGLLILDLLNQSGQQRPDAFGNPQPSWKRSAHELRYLGDDAVGPLLDVLNSLGETIASKSIADLEKQAVQRFVDAQLQGHKSDIDEFVKQYPEFESPIRQRLQNFRRDRELI